MFAKRISALEQRMANSMAKDAKYKAKFEPAYAHIKNALECCSTGDHKAALDHLGKFNHIMNEYKLVTNV